MKPVEVDHPILATGALSWLIPITSRSDQPPNPSEKTEAPKKRTAAALHAGEKLDRLADQSKPVHPRFNSAS
jgi:hypothetical protein